MRDIGVSSHNKVFERNIKINRKKFSREKIFYQKSSLKPDHFIKSMSEANLSKNRPLHEKAKNVSQDIVKVSYQNFFEGHATKTKFCSLE